MVTITERQKTVLLQTLFWVGYIIALLGFFEQCLDNGAPFWSSVLGAPFLHHGYYGFVLAAAAWLIVSLLFYNRNNDTLVK